jgi:hypothetical protein
MPSDETSSAKPRSALRRHAPGLVALALFVFGALSWFWVTREIAAIAYGFGWQQGVIAGGAGLFVTAILAEFRLLSFDEIFDWILGLFGAIVSLVGWVFARILSLFGIDLGD